MRRGTKQRVAFMSITTVEGCVLAVTCVLIAAFLACVIYVALHMSPRVPPASTIKRYVREQGVGSHRLSVLNDAADDVAVPRRLWMTYHQKDKVPAYIFENAARYAPGYEVALWDDPEIEAFLTAHFTPDVLHRFRTMPRGCFKADLFRFAVLYVHGGVYLDVKTLVPRPFAEVFAPRGLTVTRGQMYPTQGHHIGVIAAPPRHPVIARALCAVMATTDAMLQIRYHMHCVAFSVCVQDWERRGNTVRTLQEDCAGRNCALVEADRYGLCCVIRGENNDVVLHSRDPAYPY